MTAIRDSVLILCSGRARCEVAPHAGGGIAGFWWQEGRERFDWLRPAVATAAAQCDGRAMSCFPMLPYSHGLRQGRFRFFDQEVADNAPEAWDRHARYGHGWRRPWQVAERDEDHVVLEYLHAGDAWPWPYRARQRLALTEAALSLTLELENLSDALMPAGLGLRLALPVSPAASVSAAVHGVWRNDGDALPVEWTAVSADLSLSDRHVADLALDTVFTGWEGQATISWPEQRARLALAAEQPILSFLGVEKAPDTEMFWLAPASQCADAINLARAGVPGTGIRVLAPGAWRRASITLSPEHL